ncbi:MAG: RHS repeat-associated core domain-containing protein [Chloroflexi bacterium]|nr:MAG: RHS repeat-associated core domain-containing protein [Chloroflexota bacterium]
MNGQPRAADTLRFTAPGTYEVTVNITRTTGVTTPTTMSVVVVGGQTYVPHKFFYLKDHLGSTRAVVDMNGEVKESYDYYPFGLHMPGRVYLAGPAVTKNLFTGKERDAETHWDYFGARYYSPALGRWLAVDPLGEEYPSLSPYDYVANNPILNYDPDGQFIATISGTVLGAIAGAANAYINGDNVIAGAIEGGAAGLVAGAVVDLAVATGGGSLVVMGASIAGGTLGSAAGDVAGQIATNVVKGQDLLEAAKNINLDQTLEKAQTGAKLGAISGAIGFGVGKALGAAASTTKAIQATMSQNINTTAEILNRMGASQGTINTAVNKIVQGMGQAGQNTAKSILQIQVVTTVATDVMLNASQIQSKR